MDVTAPKTGHAANTLSAAVSKGNDKGQSADDTAISFTSMLKTSGDLFKTGGSRNGLDSPIARNSDQADTPETPERHTYEDDAPHEAQRAHRDDDGYERDEADYTHRDDRPAQDTASHDDHGGAQREPADSQSRQSDTPRDDHAPQQAQSDTPDTHANDGSGQAEAAKPADDAPKAQTSAPASDDNVKPTAQAEIKGLNGLEKAQNAPAQAAGTAPGRDVAAEALAAAAQQQQGVQGKVGTKGHGQADANSGQIATQSDGKDKGLKAPISAEAQVADAKGTAKGDGAAKAQAQAQAQTQPQTQAAHGAAKGDANPAQQAASQAQDVKPQQTSNAAQQQAQDLSQRLGPNNKVKVEVAVNSEADTLTSRPSASLAQSGNASAKNGQSGQGQTQGQNTHTMTPQQMQAQQQNAQQAQQAQQQNAQQAAVQAQAGQGQATKAAATASQSATSVHSAGATNAAQGTGDGAAQTASTQSGQHTQQTQQSQTAQKPQQPQQTPQQNRAALDQVNVQITKALKAGADKINIQLKPASLGRVDVQLELHDGRVTATIMADSKDTLEMLKNGARDLTRALNSAGLQADGQDLNFNLREQQNQQAQGDTQNGGGPLAGDAEGNADGQVADDSVDTGPRNIMEADRVDIHA